MAKITHPMAHELGITKCKLDETTQQLTAARAEIAVLEDEVARLRQHVPPEFKGRPQLSSPSTLSSHHKEIKCSIPRYARATRASDHRSVKTITQPQSQTTTHGTIILASKSTTLRWSDPYISTRAYSPEKYQYRDGALVRLPTGYLKSTNSSRAKLCPKIPRLVQSRVKPDETPLGGFLEPSGVEQWPSRPEDDDWVAYQNDVRRKPWSLFWLYNLDRWSRQLSDTEHRDLMDLVTLLPATRLEDDELQKTSLKYIFIDDLQQARLLIQARELAQKCLWKFVEERIPGQNPWEGWQQVRFEWGLLSRNWDRGEKYHGLLRYRASEPYYVWNTIQSVINLRHTTSHYSRSSGLFPSRLDDVDTHIKNVQRLAIQLYDKESALEARRLRDELRQAAHDTMDEITALGPLVTLPFAGYPWKHHHERVLRWLHATARDANEGRSKLDEHFPEALGRIVQDWSWQHSRRGAGAYEPPVSLGVCLRTPPKRRHSTSEAFAELVTKIKADRKWQELYGCQDPYEVPEWLLETHEQGESGVRPQTQRRLSCSI